MKLIGCKTKRRAFLTACLCAGMALAARADSDLIANSKKAEVKGVIVSRSGDLVKVQEKKSGEVVLVKLGDNTIIERERGMHAFFRHTDMDVTALVPGLTIEAEGFGNAEAQLEATKVKFNPDGFAVEVAEEQQIQANKAAVGQAQTTADQGVANAAAAQTSANQAQSSANQAQSTADQGVATAVAAGIAADIVNQRVSDLGDYATVAQVQVYFPNDGSDLDGNGKAALDQLAAATSGATGYLIEVSGYASSSGNAEHNQKLSEDRAASVVHYLIEKDNISMRRIVVPAGYGATHPAAENTDKEGRALNRRVDVKVLVNKGLHEGA
jgi:outer membrane protein OmpA-like peptidoglycan-associated protein